MGKFNSDDHYIYYCGQESLRRNGVAIIVNKRAQNAVLGCILKNGRMISVHFQGKPFNITVIQVYAPTSNAEEAEEWSRAKTNRVLPRKCTGHNKHPLSTTQEKTLYMDITRWSTPKPDWLYSLQPKMEKLYTVSKNKTGSWQRLRSWAPYCQIQTEIEESRENH